MENVMSKVFNFSWIADSNSIDVVYLDRKSIKYFCVKLAN